MKHKARIGVIEKDGVVDNVTALVVDDKVFPVPSSTEVNITTEYQDIYSHNNFSNKINKKYDITLICKFDLSSFKIVTDKGTIFTDLTKKENSND